MDAVRQPSSCLTHTHTHTARETTKLSSAIYIAIDAIRSRSRAFSGNSTFPRKYLDEMVIPPRIVKGQALVPSKKKHLRSKVHYLGKFPNPVVSTD